MSRVEYGIWSEDAGGFIDVGFGSREAAELSRSDYEDETKVLALCPDHEEQPMEGCEECDEDEEQDDEEDAE